jgi:uncharacterized protein
MTTVLRNILALTSTIILLANVHAQTTNPFGHDTTSQRKLSTYRQIFWDSLPRPSGWVNDYEGLYTDEEELVLDRIISIFKSETGIEFALVTIDTIYTTEDKFDELTLRIANSWGVGEKGKDNGILIGISRGHRKIKVNNGIGIEKLITDNETKEIIYNYFIPDFKNGRYYNGTLTGLTEIIKRLKTKLNK